MIERLFHYRVRHFIGNYDGDTVTVTIDLGFKTDKAEMSLRLNGINTPELYGPEHERAVEARDYVNSRLAAADEILVQTFKTKKHVDRSGKYGRYLAILWVDGVNLNDELLELGFADPYEA